MKKLRSRKGESLSETLVGVLISAIALLLLASMVMAATRIVSNSEAHMTKFYEGMNKIESQSDPSSGTLTITQLLGGGNTKIDINIYSDDDAELYAYQSK
ncbi:MAG: hypothetical protein PHG16_00030 [Lachnospiraceae bacterium]|nr:hypothetical protein [Lachnospiraceae bacterium]